jgi:hypothetical protein
MPSKTDRYIPGSLGRHQLDLVARERRRRVRLQVHWPLTFFRPGTTESTETATENLSSDGFYCSTNTAFVPGEIVSCTLSVPTNDRYGGDLTRPVQCRVRIIRVEVLTENDLYGVGCRIEDYRFGSWDVNDEKPSSVAAEFTTSLQSRGVRQTGNI